LIYENIRELCAKKNISISALEKKAGLGNGTIGKWRDSKPNVETLSKVADALNVSLSRLMKS
jgi:transcriptional regulator with XRE-family HTH domain